VLGFARPGEEAFAEVATLSSASEGKTQPRQEEPCRRRSLIVRVRVIMHCFFFKGQYLPNR
jgi:hypothetical protein